MSEPGGMAETGHAAGSHHQVQADAANSISDQRISVSTRQQRTGPDGQRRQHRQQPRPGQPSQRQQRRRNAGRISVTAVGRSPRASGERPAEQPVRPQHQHHRHHHEHQHQRRLRQQHACPNACSSAISRAGQPGTGQAAQAADHDHDEGVGDGGERSILQVGTDPSGKRQRATQPGQARRRGRRRW